MSTSVAAAPLPPDFLPVSDAEEIDFVAQAAKACWSDAKRKCKMEKICRSPSRAPEAPVASRRPMKPVNIHMPPPVAPIAPIHVHVPPAYRGNFALTEMSCSLHITGTSVELQVEQAYKNTSTTPLELKFSTGLGEHVVISDFEIECNGKVSKGVVQGSAEARDTYDDAISGGQVAAIGERTATASFTMSIGNLQPDQQLKVRVTMLSPLAGFLDKLYFGLPAELFPDSSNKYNLAIKAKVDLGQPAVSTFYLGSRKVVSKDGSFATTLLPTEPQVFGVQIEPSKPFEPLAVVERSVANKTLNACVTFFPEWSHIDEDLLTPYVEVLFLVDRSGSMGGQRIQAASRTLSLFLSSLPENTMFNIVGFGTKFEYLFPKSVKYDEKTRAKAQKHVDSLSANLGGTNLLEPLQDILSKEASDEFPRAVFVLTDGQVSNREQVISTVDRLALKNRSRVFALGIGSGADATLVGGIAEAGGGQHDMIPDNAPMQPVVIKQLAQALEPTLRQVKITWTGAKKGNLFPSKVPCVAQGERLTVYISDLQAGDDPIVVTLSGVAPDASPVSWNMTVSPTQFVEGEQIGRVAAWMECLELEQLGEPAGKNRIRTLGLKHRLATSQTSWVASLDNETLSDAPMKTLDVASKVKSFFNRSPSPTRTGAPSSGRGGGITRSRSPSPVRSSARGGGGGAVLSPRRAMAPPQAMMGGAPPPAPSAPMARMSSSSSSSSSSAGPSLELSMRKKSVSSKEKSEKKKEDRSSPIMMREESKQQQQQQQHQLSEDEDEEADAFGAAPPSRPSAPAPMSAPGGKPPSRGPSPVPSPKGGSSESKITLIGSLQDFQGFWKSLKDVEAFAGAITVPNPGSAAVSDAKLAEQLWATALAIAFLTVKMPDEEDRWTLLVKKARVWLKKTCVSAKITVDFIAEATKVMSA